MTKILKNKLSGLLLLTLLAFALLCGLSGCSDDKSKGPGEATTEMPEIKTQENVIDLEKDAAEGAGEADEAAESKSDKDDTDENKSDKDAADKDKAETEAGSTEELSEEEEQSLEAAGEVGNDTAQIPMDGEEGKASDETEASADDEGKNRVYVFRNDAQDFCFYVPEAYKDKTMTYGDGGAVVYTGDTTENAPYYTINRYKTDKGAYVYALWEAMAIEDEYAKYLAGPGVSPEQVDAGDRTVFRVKADYLDPDSGRGMQEFVYVEQLKDGLIVYKTKYFTDDKENVKATQNAVNLAINNICMSAEYDPDHLGPNHIGIPDR